MGHQVALNFEDGVTKVVKVGDFETIMDAAYKARINIPSDCRDGACGTCKSFCNSGEFDPGDFIDDALTEDELDDGYLLTCQAVPESDMSVQIPSTAAAAKTGAGSFSGTVTAVERFSPTTVGLTLDVQDRDSLVFLPGQYVNLTIPGTDAERSYSFSTDPDGDAASFLIRVGETGAMAEYARDRAAEGDAISFTGPYGSFFLRQPVRPVLMIAGGTGLAPLLSMLESLAAKGLDQPVHLVYGVSTEEDAVGLDRLAGLADRLDGFTWEHTISQGGDSTPNKGRVQTILSKDHLHDGDVDIYLCGPPAMVNGVREWLDEQGVSPANFYYERFAPKEQTGGDEETGAPASREDVAERGDSITASDAVSSLETGRLEFSRADSAAHLDARMGLELAITELMIGRLSEEQLNRFEALAQATVPQVSDGVVQDPEQYVRTNEEFHEYLFTISDNPMLLESYRRLDIHAQMAATFQTGTEIFPRVAQDHVDFVAAFRAEDRERAREVVMSHAAGAKDTMATAIEKVEEDPA